MEHMKNRITLEEYDLKYEDDFIEFIKEFQSYGDEFAALGILESLFNSHFQTKKTYKDLSEEEIRKFFPRYVEFMKNLRDFKTIERKDWVEADSYFICKNGKMIGEIMFRKRLNPFLLKNSLGHIGYKIKPSERGRGYGSEALRLLLNKAWESGYGELMISCEEHNIPSARVIEKNGGVLNRINRNNSLGKIEKEYWIFKQKDVES